MIDSADVDTQFENALDRLLVSTEHTFVTGRAGTGKSTLLECFRQKTEKNIAVLAPTGVAALNVGGETIHSFFRFKINVAPHRIRKVQDKEIYKNLDAIVIDEVSMVRADLLDCIDVFMRRNGRDPSRPFGGVQMIFFGDLYQLPPVVLPDEAVLFATFYDSPYFFDAHVFSKLDLNTVYLETVYRQQDDEFVGILDRMRFNSLEEEDYRLLNSRVNAPIDSFGTRYMVHLTTTNRMADIINQKRLSMIYKPEVNLRAVTEGDLSERYFPVNHDLRLKKGAQVMMLNNDPFMRWVNGSLAEIIGIEFDSERQINVIGIELEDGSVQEVLPHKWEIFRHSYDHEDHKVHAEQIGLFIQYPLKLAWAVTIHKSQGKTFDSVVIDIGGGTFAHGQLYVALSRCRSLEGISLRRPISQRHIMIDNRIVDFLSGSCYK